MENTIAFDATTNSEKKTQEVGQSLAKKLKRGDVVAIYGDLGAGKSVFVRGLAKGLGIKNKITSPTFTFIKTYKKGTLTLHHVDLYRGEDPKDFEKLALPEIFSSDAIVVIEWADRIKDLLPKKRIDIKIESVEDTERSRSKNETKRRIKISRPPVIPSLPALSPSNVSRDLKKAVEVLKAGGVVIFPTDTVYGIGCLLDNPKAVNRIYKIKGTPKTQPFPVLVTSLGQVEQLAKVNQIAQELMNNYWPGGLTIILNAKPNPYSPSHSESGSEYVGEPGFGHGKIGFRMPDSDLVRNLIKCVGKPIVGTSANFHGHPTPKSYEGLDPNFVKLAGFVVKGECKLQKESTVVDTTIDPPKILRQGAVKL